MATLYIRIALLILATTLWTSPATAGICVNLNLHATGPGPSHAVVEALERESSAIWVPYGVDLRWGSPWCPVEDASIDVAIVRRTPITKADRIVLGSTQVRMDRIERVPIVIDYDATTQTLAGLTGDTLAALLGLRWIGAQELGRALGRVAAHEIGHVLLAAPDHQRHGLMRPTFQASDMVSPPRTKYQLSAMEIGRLQFRSEWMIATRLQASGG
jgi:hypothetical protein